MCSFVELPDQSKAVYLLNWLGRDQLWGCIYYISDQLAVEYNP